MKVLTIRQPFATLIVLGIKHIENRAWQTPYRGALAIHAGKAYDRTGFHYARQKCADLGIPFPAEDAFQFGGIVGIANLMGMIYINVDNEEDGDYAHYEDDWLKWWDRDEYGWILKGSRPTEFVPLRGRLHLWDLPPDIEAALK